MEDPGCPELGGVEQERVVLATASEGVQFDRLQRQHQRLLRVRSAQDRRLDLPPVTVHDPRLPSQLIMPRPLLASQIIGVLMPPQGFAGTTRGR